MQKPRGIMPSRRLKGRSSVQQPSPMFFLHSSGSNPASTVLVGVADRDPCRAPSKWKRQPASEELPAQLNCLLFITNRRLRPLPRRPAIEGVHRYGCERPPLSSSNCYSGVYRCGAGHYIRDYDLLLTVWRCLMPRSRRGSARARKAHRRGRHFKLRNLPMSPRL